MASAERRRSDKEVVVRRARIAALVVLGKRVGYGLFAAAVLLFAVGLVAGFTGAVTTLIVVALVAGSLVLAPAIVFGYGVRAAEREDLARGSSGGQDPS